MLFIDRIVFEAQIKIIRRRKMLADIRVLTTNIIYKVIVFKMLKKKTLTTYWGQSSERVNLTEIFNTLCDVMAN